MATTSGHRAGGIDSSGDHEGGLPEESAPRLRGAMLLGTGVFACGAFLAFGLTSRLPGVWVRFVAPVLLWCGFQWFWIFVRVLCGGPDYLPRAVRGHATEGFAGFSALLVGAWLGISSGGAARIAVLPAYALIELLLRRRAFPPHPLSRYVSCGALPWVGAVAAGELLGCATALLLRSLAR